MKKIFLAVFVVAITISCSTETSQHEINETKLNTNQKSDDDLENQFNDMVASQAYIDLEAKSSAFIQKMNFEENAEDIKKGEKVLSWISANLSSTSFTDYQSAVDEFNDIEVSAGLVVSENKLFFGSWASSNPQIPGTFHPWQPAEPETEVNNCTKSCWKTYVDAVHAAIADMKMVINEFSPSPSYAGSAVREFHVYKATLQKNRDKCLQGCKDN